MSWLSRRERFVSAPLQRLFPTLVVLGVAAPALGAQYYLQPIATVTVESNSNIFLDAAGGSSPVGAYGADAAAVIGIATPDSDSNLKPRIRYLDYPNANKLNRLEAALDFNTSYKSLRNAFGLSGRFDHLNDATAQKPSALFNDVNPNAPGTSDTGRVQEGTTRDYLILRPSYTYQASQLVSLGATALYQTESFSPANLTSHVNFDFYQGNLFVGRKLSERTGLFAGGLVSRYETRDVVSTADSTGADIGITYDLAKTLVADLHVTFQRTDVNSTLSPVFIGTLNNWGASGRLTWLKDAAAFRIDLGRTIQPGSGGGLYSADQLHVEYDREISERLSYVTAARAVATRGLWANVGNQDRNYAAVDLSAKWMLTRTWIVEGGFSYFYRKYRTDPDSAYNNSFFVRCGYQGLPRQR